MKELLDMYLTFLKLGLVSFGGGVAILKLYEDELVEKKKWLTSKELTDFYVLAQTIPGIIIANTALLVGYKKKKFLGMIATLCGVVTIPIAIIICLGSVLKIWIDNALFNSIVHGISSVVIFIMFSMIYRLAKLNIKNIRQVLIAVLTFVLIHYFKVNILLVLVLVALTSIIIFKNDEIEK